MTSFHPSHPLNTTHGWDRRAFLKTGLLASAAAATGRLWADGLDKFQLRYVVGSSIYGNLPLSVILPEVRKTGAEFIDLWPRKWGTQREQVDEMGYEKFGQLLEANRVRVAISTRFDLGPFKLEPEMKFLRRFGGEVIVVGCKGPIGLKGAALRTEVKKFADQMQPHLAAAEEAGITIALENHADTIIETPDAIRWLAEFAGRRPLGIALAPYHLQQDPSMLAGLIRDLGPKLALFYGWQYGAGCMKPMPEEQETLQLPGRGNLDFTPLLQALKDIRFAGWTEIFMHHTPRGLPPFPTVPPITAELVHAHDYLSGRLAALHS